MIENVDIEKLNKIFEKFPVIKLVYFFGSMASGQAGPLSDYDFAIYFDLKKNDGKDRNQMFEIKFKLMDELSRALGTDKIDVVILNLSEEPEFKYNIIKSGKLIYDQEPFRVLIEPRILNEYFDFRYFMQKYNLTRV